MSASFNPYAAPEAPPEVRVGSWRIALRRAGICLGASAVLWALAIAAGETLRGPGVVLAAVGAGLAVVGSLCGCVLALMAMGRAARGPSPKVIAVVGSLALGLLHAAMAFFGGILALLSLGGGRGRQLRRRGRVLLPRLESGSAWSHTDVRCDVDDRARGGLAAEWRENARTEHASVGAFAMLTMDLMALGAPPELLAAANRDALDEIRHTQACLSLATAIDGVAEGPAPFPESRKARTLPRTRTLGLAHLAVDSLVDGVLHEGVSARILARLAKRATEPTIRERVAGLAADEGRHAAHAWQVVEWCVAEGGEPIVAALRGAARRLPETMRTTRPREAEAGQWERWGIPGAELEEREFQAARAAVVKRVEALRT